MQNAIYVVQWWFFAAIMLVSWWRLIRAGARADHGDGGTRRTDLTRRRQRSESATRAIPLPHEAVWPAGR